MLVNFRGCEFQIRCVTRRLIEVRSALWKVIAPVEEDLFRTHTLGGLREFYPEVLEAIVEQAKNIRENVSPRKRKWTA